MKPTKYPIHFEHMVPILEVSVNWIFCEDITKVREYIAKDIEIKIEEGDEKIELSGLVESDNKGSFVMYFDVADLTKTVIAHEVLHLTNHIFAFLEAQDEEIGARVCQYLTSLTYDCLFLFIISNH